jgi:restriction system protein
MNSDTANEQPPGDAPPPRRVGEQVDFINRFYAEAGAARRASVTAAGRATAQASVNIILPLDDPLPGLLLQTVIELEDKTKEGQLVRAVAFTWFEILKLIDKDPNAIYQLGARKWEEMIAAAYHHAGFEVILTPLSGDHGIDVIASSKGIGAVRYLDQVKAYRPGHLVTAAEVRDMVGVLNMNRNASKGVITTTSNFAPRIMEDPNIAALVPYRLELKPRDALLHWLYSIAQGDGGV